MGPYHDRAGYAGFQLSSDDMATLLVKLRDGTLLPADWNAKMNAGQLGWVRSNAALGPSRARV